MASDGKGVALARGLGWFSVGLGVSQLAAPGGLARTIGVLDRRGNRLMMRASGVRKLIAGFGILAKRGSSPGWVWARVGSDLIDLALLVGALRSPCDEKRKVGAALGAVLGVAALDLIAAKRLGSQERGREAGVLSGGAQTAHHAVTINRPLAEVFRLWRQLRPLESDQELVEELTDARLRWRSREDSLEYVVLFAPAPGGRGTEVLLQLRYQQRGGKLGSAVAKLFQRDPSLHVQKDLREFKQILETGDVVHSDASIHRGMHPARPTRQPVPAPHQLSTVEKETTP